MSVQKALILTEKQGQWTVGENPIFTPGPKDVLVKILSAALNPIEWKIQTLGYFASTFPTSYGADAAGEVVEVGSEVTNRAVGDKIFFQGFFQNERATFQQYCLVAAELTAKIPANISLDQAASIPLALATVATGLWSQAPEAKSLNWPAPWEEGGLTTFQGKAALILGGSSSVGQYAIQLAKLSGFSPIITTASLHNASLPKSLGATHVLDRSLSHADALAEIRKITDKPIEYVYDAVSGAETLALGYAALAPGGSMLTVLPPEIAGRQEGDEKKVVWVFGSVVSPENRALGVELYSRLTEWVEKGIIVPNRVEVIPGGLAGIPAGLDRLKENKVSGFKLITHPQETP